MNHKTWARNSIMCILPISLMLIIAVPASAQRGAASTDQGDAQRSAPIQPYRANQVANSAVGQVGQRQTREQAASNIETTRRIASRIQNRVQSRLRNRIDGHYDPQANAAAPFRSAEDEARKVGRPRH